MKYLKRFENKTLDEILDKISKDGMENLTDNEKDFLDRYSNGENVTELEKEIKIEKTSNVYSNKIGQYDATIYLYKIVKTDYDNFRYTAKLKIDNKIYFGYIEFFEDDMDGQDTYATLYFENNTSDIFTDFEGLEYEIDNFCEEAFYKNIK